MKKKDVLLVVVVAIISGVFSLLIANYLFGGKRAYDLKAPTVDAITADFKLPPETYFNKQSINITKNITIGDTGNNTPFNNAQP
jgi:hypothetical protein